MRVGWLNDRGREDNHSYAISGTFVPLRSGDGFRETIENEVLPPNRAVGWAGNNPFGLHLAEACLRSSTGASTRGTCRANAAARCSHAESHRRGKIVRRYTQAEKGVHRRRYQGGRLPRLL